MCNIGKHLCYCKTEYECNVPNWICSTINGDEDANMCDACLNKLAEEMQEWQDNYKESEDV